MGYEKPKWPPKDPPKDDDKPRHDDKQDPTNDIYVKVEQDMDLDVDLEHKTDSDLDYHLDVRSPPYVHVDITTNEHREITDKTTIEFTEKMVKDIDVDVSDWNVDVDVKASNIIQDVVYDTDVNDIDNSKLIDVDGYATLSMDDFLSDQLAIGNSFNGPGNDLQFNVTQNNELNDDDHVGGVSLTYNNHQAPNVDASLTLRLSESEEHGGGKEPPPIKVGPYGPPNGGPSNGGGHGGGGGWSSEASGSLVINLDLTAPTAAFQTVTADGGKATAGDGIESAYVTDADGDVNGSTSATTDAEAIANAFTADVIAGANTQANFANLNIVGNNMSEVGDVDEGPGHPGGGGGGYDGPGSHDASRTGQDGGNGSHPGGGDDDGGLAIRDVLYDDDINDLDSSELINVEGHLYMDDFNLDLTAIGNSFNGPGNDMQFDVNQANDLVDQDSVYGIDLSYTGAGWNGPFQNVSASGGYSTTGNGIGDITSSGTDGISGAASASGDALAAANAFTANIVVGANLQLNNFTATVVGGDAYTADDLS